MKAKYTNKDWLYKEYIENERSTINIAEEIGVSHKTISRWLRKHEIATRDVRQAIMMKQSEERNNTQRTIEYYIETEQPTI